MKIALLGIGLMGRPMALRVLAAGWPLTVWNRSPDKAHALREAGATVAAHAAEAVADADLVLTMLTHGGVVRELLQDGGVLAAIRPGALFVDMSSIQPAEAREHAAWLAARGVGALDAPVSGGTLGAEAGTLAIMAGGSSADFERALPVFAALGRATHVGPTGTGQLAKLANQMIVGITIGAVAEALILAERGGADPARVRLALQGGFADSRILEVHGQRMVQRDFAKRAAMTVQLKDLRNALATAAGDGTELPITTLFAQLYAEAIAHGHAEADHAGLWLELAARNGLR
ncbi:NAD(P)-dependent oxidoreductase [Piscinibacter sp. Jin2]|uniref:NAD(P)-dependent oxidoreductase n=1 Tax=Aquariibacter lacus TaxID=2801332 RepID=A0A9X1BRL1_9BURK|nr:NAD(P)-dependent oxidoreductase [Piscinibacter lacus]MBL0719688.1 NAD(P)-dependent oxidoreductase [Piscinibacter lacus]